jgi:hypothetical protein
MVMRELDDIIEQINIRTSKITSSLRRIQNIPCSGSGVEPKRRIIEGYNEILIKDREMLKQANQMKNEEMKKKFTTKKIQMNNLYGVSGGIKVGKDLVGEMIQYLGDSSNVRPSFEGFEDFIKPHKYRVSKKPTYEIKKCADKLKDCVCVILGCTRAQLENRDFKEKELGEEWWLYERNYSVAPFHNKRDIISKGEYDNENEDGFYRGWKWDLLKLTPRMMLQLLGTEGGRMVIHPNIWVNALFSDYTKSKWIITDVRFPENEGKAILSRGGLMIGIKRHFGLRFPEYAFRQYEDRPYDIPSMLMNDNEELFDVLNHESETAMGDHSWCDVVIENNGTMEELFNNVLNAVKWIKKRDYFIE